MRFIKDVDTGELIPISNDSEEEAFNNIPGYVKDDFPEIKSDYCGVNDIVLDLTNQLKAEKESKTVIHKHKFPVLKIIAAALVVGTVVVGCFFGVRFVSSIEFITDPVVINSESESAELYSDEYFENSEYSEYSEESEESEELEKSFFHSSLLRLLVTALSIISIKFATSFLLNTLKDRC